MEGRVRNLAARCLGPLVAAALAGSACGSSLSHDQLLSASQETIRVTSTSPTAGATAPSGATPAQSPGAPAVSVGTPDAGSVNGSQVGASGAAPAGNRPVGAASSSGTVPAAGSSRGSGSGVAAPTNTSPAAPAPGPNGSGATSAGSAAVPASGQAEIRLGSFGTQTGPLGGILLPLVQGAKAWVADVNARGGMAGHPVRLVMADDGGDPNRALALARRMVEQDKVQAFYAVHSPTALQAATPYLEQRQVPIIGVCECSPIGDDSPMVFHPGTGSKLGVYWAHLGPLLHYYPDKKKVAILYCREAATCAGIKDGMKPLGKPHGIEWVYEAQVSLAQPDFTAEVLAARNAGAEAVIGIFDNASVIRMLKSADRQGYHPVVSSQQATYEDRFIRDGGDIINGVVVASNSAPYNTAPQLADYRAAMDRFVPGGVKSAFGGEMYGTGKLLEILAKSIPADPTSADFLKALHALRGETVGGIFPPLAFKQGTGHGDTNPCIIPVKVENRQFVPASNNQFLCPPGWKPVQP